MKVWLDDEFEQRKGWFDEVWIHARWPADVIELLKTGTVTELSLDHDLGEDSSYAKPRTGYDVLLWIEEQVKEHRFVPPRIRLHTQNASGRDKMKAACRQILLYHEANLQSQVEQG